MSCDGVSCPANQYCYLSLSAYGNSTVCMPKTCKSDGDCDCGVCFAGTCAPHMAFCVSSLGGAQSASNPYSGGGGVTGRGTVIDSGMGGAGGSIDGGSG